MCSRIKPRPYRIVGAYDSETTNLVDNGIKSAFPVTHQIGIIEGEIQEITSENVEKRTEIHIFRHSLDLYNFLESLAIEHQSYVPVICCHNLAFDMYGLAPFLQQHEVRVLAKSQRKPISFTILDDDGKPCLVIWDTLVFSSKSLAYMGDECGYPKLKGDWDYTLVRTPSTPISAQEEAYAAHDVYALLAWIGYWCRLNPDINPTELAQKVVSKTGIVRRRRVQRFSKVRGKGQRRTIGQWWGFINSQNAFGTDQELFTCTASTRGGFTFCASSNASRVFDFTTDDHMRVYGFDATSQHPSQIVSHRYPVRFQETTPENLTQAFKVISLHTLDNVLDHYEKPFGVAFYGCFHITNLRLKPNTPFGDYGIAPLAWARCTEYVQNSTLGEENQQGEEFRQHLADTGYRDKVIGGIHHFGKLESASEAWLWCTELTAWEISQAYDYDSCEGVFGYMTLSFDKPSDMCVVSVMQFYAAKNAFKHARKNFYAGKPMDNEEDLLGYGIPEFVVSGMKDGSISDSLVESTYLGLKADLNSLFGIEACNEYRRDTVLGESGIEYTGDFGICNAPKKPKAWYQCGQRIVGWSRIAQCVVMELCYPYVETIVNGDTDSVKFVIKDDNVPKVRKALERMDKSIDKAKDDVCSRVRKCYPGLYDPLDGIGHYVLEFDTLKFCAAWNKAYCISEKDPRDGKEHIHFTLAGVPSRGADVLADKLIGEGWSFGAICDTFLGYNVTYAHDITGLNARSFPEWGDLFVGEVQDYQGKTSRVVEPRALCLYPMAKTVNDTGNSENSQNMVVALRNRPTVNVEPTIIFKDEIRSLGGIIKDEYE